LVAAISLIARRDDVGKIQRLIFITLLADNMFVAAIGFIDEFAAIAAQTES
jgi:hypothetical protein